MRHAAAAFVVVAALFSAPADAATSVYNVPPTPSPACTLHRASNAIYSMSTLPPPIANFITSEVGPMADRGKAFNKGDYPIPSLPFARFILAGQLQNGWFIWYEQGGGTYGQRVVILNANKDGTMHLAGDALLFPPAVDLCAATEHLVSDPSFSNGGKLY